jgi:hypothetical protein
MPTRATCPEVPFLEGYVLGRTSDAEAQHLEQHLSGCRRCLGLLPSLGEGDGLVVALRAQKNKPRPKNAALNRLQERLRDLRPQGATGVFENTSACGLDATPPTSGILGAEDDPVRALLTPPQRPDELGRLGGYRVLKVLGSGGMGVVFEAEDPQLKRRVALKAMRPALAGSSAARQRFLREAQRMAALTHDNILAIHQVGADGAVPFLAMPLLQGESLAARLVREGKLPLAEVLRIGRETALGLAAAHQQGVIHRDVKPANLWLEGPAGRVKILDFGLARLAEGDAGLTCSGAVVGTPQFMAPEQAGGEIDPRADLFSLGCVLYRMVTGQPAFRGATPVEVLRNVALLNPTPARQLVPETPEALSRLIERLLAKAREGRPASALHVVQELEALERATAARRPPRRAAPKPAAPWPGKPARAAVENATEKTAPTGLSGQRRGKPTAARAGRGWQVFVVLLLAVGVTAAGLTWKLLRGPAPMGGDGLSGEGTGSQGHGRGAPELGSKLGPTLPPLSATSLVATPLKVKGLQSWTIIPRDTLDAPRQLALFARGKQLHVRQEDVWRGWDLTEDRPVSLPFKGNYTALSPDGHLIAVAKPKAIELFRHDTDKKPLRVLDLKGDASGLFWSRQGKRVAAGDVTGSATDVFGLRIGTVVIWDLSEAASGVNVDTEPGGTRLVGPFSPDGQRMASQRHLTSNQTPSDVTILDAASGKTLLEYGFSKKTIYSFWSPDGAKLATWATDGTVQVADAKTGKELYQLKGCYSQHVQTGIGSAAYNAVAWSPDGKTLAYGDDNNAVLVWDVEKKALRKTLKGHDQPVTCMAFTPDGKTLISTGLDRTVRFWDLTTDKPRGALVFLKDGHWLAISPEGFYKGSDKVEEHFKFVVKQDGSDLAEDRTPAEFVKDFGWKNEPGKVRLAPARE